MVDFQKPDYVEIYAERSERIRLIESDLERYLPALRVHYRSHPAEFVSDWGMTFDPRLLERGLPASVPFILWKRQREYLEWLHMMWRSGERGLVEKSRDCGVTWLSAGFAVSMMLFEPGFVAGFGSRKEDLVDKSGDMDSIFEKVRFFYSNLPWFFIPEKFDPNKHSAHMKLVNPDSGGGITGEAGDNIGRGGRKSVHFNDESAFIERQKKVDAALSQTTNCQIDISTPNGSGNEFFRKRQRWDKTNKVFVFDWRDDPRKDQAWYDKQCRELDPVVVAQEIDRDYDASGEDSFIPAKWVRAALDAHITLGFIPSGIRATGFDPADTGDAKGIVSRHGSVFTQAEHMTSGDITNAVPWAFQRADENRSQIFKFDADGMGAPTMKMALNSMSAQSMAIQAYLGSGEIEDPDEKYIPPGFKRSGSSDLSDLKTNAEMFRNYRAQSWTWLRDRFEMTYVAVTRAKAGQVVNFNVDSMISISSECVHHLQLMSELSRPKRIFDDNGKILVESKKHMKGRSIESPNLADSAVICTSAKQAVQTKRKNINFVGIRDHFGN